MQRPGVTTLILSFLTLLFITAACGDRSAGTAGPAKEAAAVAAGSDGWEVIGPGGGGAQYEPTINPSDPKHVFVRCDMTGAYVSDNGGESWRMFNLRTVVRDFEFDSQAPSTVYACNTGLYRSEDRGQTWRLIYPDSSDIVREVMRGDHAGQRFITRSGEPAGSMVKVRVDPAGSEIIYLALRTGGYRSEGGCTIVTSLDRGDSWEELAVVSGSTVHAIFPGSWSGDRGHITVITDLTCARIDRETGDVTELPLPVERVQMADGGKGPVSPMIYVLGETGVSGRRLEGGLFRSDDMGQTWVQANGNLAETLTETGRVPEFRAFAVCSGQSQVAYLSCGSYYVMENGSPQRYSGIFKTTDGGESWEWALTVCAGRILSENYEGGWLYRNLGWFRNPSYLGVCPGNPNVCYGTDSGRTIKTEDGGKTWQQVISRDLPDRSFTTRGLDVTTTYGVHFDPFDPDHYFITYTDIGLFHTWNDGRSWEHSITGIPRQWRNTCYWLEFDPDVRGRIYSCWSNVHDLPRPKMFRSGNLVNGRQQGGVAVSGDGGHWWGLLHKGVMEGDHYTRGMRLGAVCTHILIDPDSPVDSRTLYVCDFGYGVWKSSDGGETWELSNEGLSGNLNAWRIERLPSGRLILLVARGGIEGREMIPGALYYSDDGAETWRGMGLPENVTAPNDLVHDPSNPSRMYLSTWPLNVDGEEVGGGLWRTGDGGRSWKQVFQEDMHVYAAAVDPHDNNTVYINTFDSAAFRSEDRGDTWYRLGGYNFKWGHRPVPHPLKPGRLFLTTFGGSVYYGPAEGEQVPYEDIVNLPYTYWRN